MANGGGSGSRKTLATLLLVALGAAVPYAVPSLRRLRPVRPGELSRLAAALSGSRPRVALFVPRPPAPAPLEEPRPPVPSPGPAPTPGPSPAPQAGRRRPRIPLPETAPLDVEDPAGVLVPFFRRLAAVERRETGTLVRITHFGDSPLTGDLISSEARALLQDAFGDGGHGFVLLGRPWPWYGHRGVTLSSSGWKVRSPLLSSGNGGHHGLGGVSFTARSADAASTVTLDEPFTRVVLTFTRRPGGGHLLVSLDGGPPAEVATAGEGPSTGSAVLEARAGATRLAVRPKGDGEVTVYGAVLERPGPGVVYDAVGANGASVHFLTLLDAEGWEQALRSRGSDLVILNYGTNESGYAGIPGPRYLKDYAEVVGRVRRALPGAAILLMAPMDRGQRDESGAIVTWPTIPRIVAAQREAARADGCAFFDTFRAMGGAGTMARWYDAEPRLVTGDFTHTTKAGSDRVARLLVGALVKRYREWQAGGASPAPSPPPAPEVAPPAAPAPPEPAPFSRRP